MRAPTFYLCVKKITISQTIFIEGKQPNELLITLDAIYCKRESGYLNTWCYC